MASPSSFCASAARTRSSVSALLAADLLIVGARKNARQLFEIAAQERRFCGAFDQRLHQLERGRRRVAWRRIQREQRKPLRQYLNAG